MDYSQGYAQPFGNTAAGVVSGASTLPPAFTAVFTNYIASPFKSSLFYSVPTATIGGASTQQGSLQITCYMRFNGFQPLTYYAGASDSLVADVVNRKYSIGYVQGRDLMRPFPSYNLPFPPIPALSHMYRYVVLGDTILKKLNVPLMINKAGKVVQANQDSVSYAVQDKGGSIDPTFNFAQLMDSAADKAWPVSSFTYWFVRKNTHIGSCAQRQAAMSFMYNFYTSASVNMAAQQLGFAMLPTFMAAKQQALMRQVLTCNDGVTLALQKYITVPSTILASTIVKDIVTEFVDAYAVVDPTATLQTTFSEDSRSVWAAYAKSPSTYAGVFSTFGSKADKLAQYGAVQNVYTNAFAHVAVVPIYSISKLKVPLQVTPAIIGGILAGTIVKWNDALILAANPTVSDCTATALTASQLAVATVGCLPAATINVAVRSDTTDVNAVILRYLTNVATTPFAAAYASSGATDFYTMPWAAVTALGVRVAPQTSNSRVDTFVLDFDNRSAPQPTFAARCSLLAAHCSLLAARCSLHHHSHQPRPAHPARAVSGILR